MHSWWLSGLAFHSEWNIIQSFSLCICCYFIIFFIFSLFCFVWRKVANRRVKLDRFPVPFSEISIQIGASSINPSVLNYHHPRHYLIIVRITGSGMDGREGGRDGAWNMCAPFIPPEGHRITKKTQTDRKIEETETEFDWLLFNGEFQFSW